MKNAISSIIQFSVQGALATTTALASGFTQRDWGPISGILVLLIGVAASLYAMAKIEGLFGLVQEE